MPLAPRSSLLRTRSAGGTPAWQRTAKPSGRSWTFARARACRPPRAWPPARSRSSARERAWSRTPSSRCSSTKSTPRFCICLHRLRTSTSTSTATARETPTSSTNPTPRSTRLRGATSTSLRCLPRTPTSTTPPTTRSAARRRSPTTGCGCTSAPPRRPRGSRVRPDWSTENRRFSCRAAASRRAIPQASGSGSDPT